MKKLTEYRHIYFLGIGGIGMSAIAKYCLQQGIKVSGYDRQRSPITDQLVELGAQIEFEDDPSGIQGTPELVIYTPAIKEGELRSHFEKAGITMVKRSEVLGWLTQSVDTVAVGGTHGKTTTSSMISFLLSEAGIKHTAMLGGIATNYDSNFISESMDLMVVEADEYDRSFHRLYPRWIVLTAMDADHLDIYGSHEEMINGYRQFIRQIQDGGLLLYRHDLYSVIGKEIIDELDAKDVQTYSFGIHEGHYHTTEMRVQDGVWHWNLQTPWGTIDNLELMMPGQHNVLNATAASALVLNTGVTEENLKSALKTFKGVTRRFEIRYQDDEHVLIDDYAHHPEELRAAINAAKETYGKPVTGDFQPHLYSRTKDLAKEFAEALDLLDHPVIIDIYPAREKPIEGVSSQMIFDLMKNPEKKYIKGDDWIKWIAERKPHVLITLGAGDLDKHIPELIRMIYKK